VNPANKIIVVQCSRQRDEAVISKPASLARKNINNNQFKSGSQKMVHSIIESCNCRMKFTIIPDSFYYHITGNQWFIVQGSKCIKTVNHTT